MIEFGRGVCGDLAAAERREWLVTNGLGSFASGTIAGTLTRRYHGLLIAAFRPPVERMLLITKIDELANYGGQTYALATNRWHDDYISPSGFTLIQRFYLDGTTPMWEYALADALLEKRIWMEPGADVTYVRYRLLRAAAPVDLSLRVFVNYRNFHLNTHAGDWQMGLTAESSRCVRVDAVPDGRPFWVTADNGAFALEGVWYRDYVLAEETARGLDDRDDHLAAASLTVRLAPDASVCIACSDALLPAVAAEEALGRRREHEADVERAYADAVMGDEGPSWLQQCALAADQFVVAHPIAADSGARSVIAGYHWFGDWARDTMVALPGLTLTTGRPEIARNILTTFSKFLVDGMLPNFFPDDGEAPQYNAVDAPLWYIEAAARYFEVTSDEAALRALWPALQEIIARYR
ncbi:MAG: glycogen debranching enzyme family protein, partial [Candidatus Eremiobacteraeota bacterium]|nr:glycogen debranching enzyme family protein [Candidatus Eremiobacteraeota bacterium]